MRIENDFCRVEVDPKNGAVRRVLDKRGGIDLIAEPRLAESFRLLLPMPRPPLLPQANYILGTEQKLSRVEQTASALTLRWDGPLTNAAGAWDVSVAMRIELIGASVQFRIEVENRTELTLAEVWHAGLGGIMGLGARAETETLLPTHGAARTESLFRTFPESMGPGGGGGFRTTEFHRGYPNNLSMPWVSLYNRRLGRGACYACHDEVARYSALRFEMHPGLARNRLDGNWPTEGELAATRGAFPPGIVMHWVHFPYLAPGKTFAGPPVVLQFHDGDWHAAARIYREWFVSKFPLRAPGWLRRAQAVCDIIFLLPEGNVVQTFRDIPRLAADAKRYGVDAFLISGWMRGGHDNRYPDYSPDERLGTWEDLAAGIRACHDIGVKAFFFANIDTVDVSTERYRRELDPWRMTTGSGEPQAPYGFGMGTLSARLGMTRPPLSSCDPAFPQYRKIIVDQMRRLAELGADGVHFDKVCAIGMDFNPALPLPADQAMYSGTIRCIEETLDACRKVNPDFCVGVESSWDRLLSYADAWWNWIDGIDHVSATKYAFPEWLPTFAVVQPHDYGSVNNAIRFAYQLLIGPGRWSHSMADPQWRGLSRYIREVIRIRKALADTIYFGEFLDTLEARVNAGAGVRFNTHRNARTGKRACVLANFAARAQKAAVAFAGNPRGPALVYEPFRKPRHARLPLRLTIPPGRLAVVAED